MDKGRWKLLMENDNEPLSELEKAEGWHFCLEMDGLLMGPGMWGVGDEKCFCGIGPKGEVKDGE